MSAQPAERPTSLVTFYALYFMSVGVSLPFLPGFFKTLGFTGNQAGLLLAVGPTLSLVMPPLWGQLTDRSGRPGVVLCLVTLGGALGYALLARVTNFPEAIAALCVTALFTTSITATADTLALHHVHQHGGTYASIRIWGSLGFVIASLPFGFFITTVDRVAVLVPMTLLLAAAIACGLTLARVPAKTHEGPKPTVENAVALAKKPEIFLFLIATALHWVASAPWHGSLAPHVTDLGLPPWVIGVCSSVSVGSEVLVMFTWPRWAGRFSPRQVLLGVFAVSAVRWAVMGLTSNPAVLIASAGLHGITFGAFYLASVEWMSRRAPGSMRATGQALFTAATFGLGGIVGFRLAGHVYDALGGHRLFLVAAGLAVLPAVAIALTPQRPRE